MAFDTVRTRTVLFGGNLLGDTWEWDGSYWTQMNDIGPAGRSGHAMAFGGAGTILFGGQLAGGQVLADTWSWNGDDWTQLADGGPAPRAGVALAFDSDRQRIVLFGGNLESLSVGPGSASDTWEWDGAEWTQQADTGPIGRQFHSMAYDSTRKRVVLFGGVGGSDQGMGDTWEWDGSVWTQVSSFGADACAGAAAAFRAVGTVLFGGIDTAAPVPSAKLFGNTWEWDGNHWALRQDIGPGARWLHAMAYDSKRKRLVLFGGAGSIVGNESLLGDTWEHAD